MASGRDAAAAAAAAGEKAGRGVVESGSESTRGRRRGAGALFGLEEPGAGGMGGMDREVRLWDGAAWWRCCSAGLVGIWSGLYVLCHSVPLPRLWEGSCRFYRFYVAIGSCAWREDARCHRVRPILISFLSLVVVRGRSCRLEKEGEVQKGRMAELRSSSMQAPQSLQLDDTAALRQWSSPVYLFPAAAPRRAALPVTKPKVQNRSYL